MNAKDSMTPAEALAAVALLPCPFCAFGSPAIVKASRGSGFYVACGGCQAGTFAMTEAEAIAAWNRRSLPGSELAVAWYAADKDGNPRSQPKWKQADAQSIVDLYACRPGDSAELRELFAAPHPAAVADTKYQKALEEILQVQVKDSGYGPERFTSGDGHARCVEIARAALSPPAAKDKEDGNGRHE